MGMQRDGIGIPGGIDSLERLVFEVEMKAEDLLQEEEVRTHLSVLDCSLKFNAIYR